MKRRIGKTTFLGLALVAMTSLFGCEDESPIEEAGESVEEAADSVEDAAEDVGNQ